MNRLETIQVLQALADRRLKPSDCLIKTHIVHGVAGAWKYEKSVIDDEQLQKLRQKVTDINKRRNDAGVPLDRFVLIVES